MELDKLLAELEEFGSRNDSSQTERSQKMLNITKDTGEFLTVFIKAAKSRSILEIGTSNGYSTIWLAIGAVYTGGRITTVDFSEVKAEMAKTNFEKAGLTALIEQVVDDAGNFLKNAQSDTYDFIFLDSQRSAYTSWLPDIKRILRRGGSLVVDNALSHKDEMDAFISAVNKDSDFTTCLLTVGNGQYVAVLE
ncbi:MAG: O-methyltransferase [Deferribacterales bacterium]